MRQVFITGHGGPDKLQVRESPDPTPGQGEVRIRVQAIGINFADILARQGLYQDAPKVPCVVGYEVSGVIDATGSGVDASWVGKDAVALTRFGGYSDVVIVPVAQVFEKPGSLSHERAAAIPVNYLTAWQLLVVMGSLKANETVLIHNAGGGVGLAAIDIARHIGATIFGTASSSKHPFLKQRGLHEAIDYRTGDWTLELARLTEWQRRRARHRSHWRQPLAEELQGTALDRTARNVRDLRGDHLKVIRTSPHAACGAGNAAFSSDSARQSQQMCLRREHRTSLA